MDSPPKLLGSVLVFGGSGFLGYHLTKQLSEAPDVSKVTVFDVNTSKNRVNGVEYIEGSIASKVDVEMAFQNAHPNVLR